MSDLLILGTDILAIGPFTITDDSIIAPDIVFPKSIIPGWEIVSADLPEGFLIADYEWVSGHLQLKNNPSNNNINPENSIFVTQSFNSSLRRKAAKLEQQGNTFEAVQLLLQAQGVQT